MKGKRVLVLIPHDNGEDNGITRRSTVVCDILNHEYASRTLGPKSSYADNVVVLAVKFLIWMLKLTYLIPQQNADCIYCCQDWFGFISAWALSKVRGFPVIFEAQGILSEENRAKNRPEIVIDACSLIERFVISRADYVVTLSGNIMEFYAKYNSKIELVPVFIDESIYHRSCPRAPGLKTIGLIGPFDNPQNKPYLEFLYARIDEFDPRIRFKVIGRGAHKIADRRVTYMDYISSRDEYVAELASLDALLVPATFNMAGPLNKILEAMASSLPVFTTPEGAHGLDDYAEENTNILIANRSELAAYVNQVIFDEARCDFIGANARTTVEQRYSTTASSVQLTRIIDALLDER